LFLSAGSAPAGNGSPVYSTGTTVTDDTGGQCNEVAASCGTPRVLGHITHAESYGVEVFSLNLASQHR
jgi:hypothetical protein